MNKLPKPISLLIETDTDLDRQFGRIFVLLTGDLWWGGHRKNFVGSVRIMLQFT